MSELEEWPEVLALVKGAMVAGLRGDRGAVQAAVSLIPASMLRPTIAVVVEAYTSVVVARAGGHGDLLADEVSAHLVQDQEDPGAGG